MSLVSRKPPNSCGMDGPTREIRAITTRGSKSLSLDATRNSSNIETFTYANNFFVAVFPGFHSKNMFGFDWKVVPTNVEKHVMTHPAVEDVAVVGLPHDEDGERPMAFVVLSEDSKVSRQTSWSPTPTVKFHSDKFSGCGGKLFWCFCFTPITYRQSCGGGEIAWWCEVHRENPAERFGQNCTSGTDEIQQLIILIALRMRVFFPLFSLVVFFLTFI